MLLTIDIDFLHCVHYQEILCQKLQLPTSMILLKLAKVVCSKITSCVCSDDLHVLGSHSLICCILTLQWNQVMQNIV